MDRLALAGLQLHNVDIAVLIRSARGSESTAWLPARTCGQRYVSPPCFLSTARRRCRASSRRNPRKVRSRTQDGDDIAVVVPTPSREKTPWTRWVGRGIRHSERHPTVSPDLFQLTLSKESDPLTIRRKERGASALCARKRHNLALVKPACGEQLADLARRSLDATNGHALAAVSLTPEQQQRIVAFEMGLDTAQAVYFRAGRLNSGGAQGGPAPLTTQLFFIGINDPLGFNPSGAPFTSVIFTPCDAWEHSRDEDEGRRRAAIARGQALFNSKTIRIEGVGGLNDATGIPTLIGTCGTCHDTPNVGNHSISAPLNIGIAELTNPLGIAYLPVIALRNKTTGEIIRTTDPGAHHGEMAGYQ